MSRVYGQWLLQQRHARGWNVRQMGRQLREAAKASRDTLPSKESLDVMIRRWERDSSGVSERYRLHYCKAFQIPTDRFGDPATLSASHANGKQPEAIMARPRRQSTTGAPAEPPQLPSLRDRIHAALDPLGDPANRDQLCFLLGYVSALMATFCTHPMDTAALECPPGRAKQTAVHYEHQPEGDQPAGLSLTPCR